MATKQEWLDYFELINDRQASSEEISSAYAAGEIERSSEEISLSESAVSSESLAVSLSESQSFSESESESQALQTPQVSKQEWLDYFEMINGRKPNFDEFQAAKANGEFTEPAEQPTPQSAPTAQVSTPQPVVVQSSVLQQISSSESEKDEFGRVIQPDVVNAVPTATGKVGFLEAFKLFFKNYVNFKGRSSRAEYWYVVLWMAIISCIPVILLLVATASTVSVVNSYDYSTNTYTGSTSGLGASWGSAGIAFVLLIIFGLATIVPAIALVVRRFRDVGISHVGYIGFVIISAILAFLQIIPILGSLALLAFGIYELVVLARPSDHYLTHKEPISDWIIAHFGKK